MDKILSNKARINIMPLMYIILVSISFLYKVDKFFVSFFIKYIVGLILIILALGKLVINKNLNDKSCYKGKGIYTFYLIMNSIPYLIILMCSMFLWFINDNIPFTTITRACSTIMYMELGVIVVQCVLYLFEEKALIYTFYGMVMTYTIVIMTAIVRYGFAEIIKFMITLQDSDASACLEVHEITFAFGLYLIYFIFFENKDNKHRMLRIVITILYIYMGYKRIQMLALGVTIMFFFILRKLKEQCQVTTIRVWGIILLILCFAYVAFIKNGGLELFANNENIDFMGRLQVYDTFSKYYDFNIFYYGLGYASTTKMLENISFTFGKYSSMHSDILKIYIELGFLGSFLWFYHYLVFYLNKIKKVFSNKVAIVYFSLILYSFINYMTDNIATYYNYQNSLMLILFCISLSELRKKEYRASQKELM